MDRLNQIRGEAGSSRDLTLDTTSPPSEAFMTANEGSSKYFSLSEVDSTFSISPSKDSLAAASGDPDRTITTDNELISNLSPIPKKSDLDSYKIGKQIEAANILSGGVNIFDDNDNSYDGDELVIDDNVIVEDEKGNADIKLNENAEFPIDKNENLEPLEDSDSIPSKDTEVVLQIDGKNVDAIDIGNGLYLYRKAGEEELAAVQIIDNDQQQPSFKFLKVRENSEGNLEVYEEIEIEIPKEVPTKEGNPTGHTSSHVPIKDISKMINEPTANKVADKINKTPKNESNVTSDFGLESNVVELQTEVISEVNLNGKMMKFNESRKSPIIGTYTPMTYHSTPNKEGIPLTKTMVDQQLQPSRHSDNIKKTIEVHTDSCRQKLWDTSPKNKDTNEIGKTPEITDNLEIVENVVVSSNVAQEDTKQNQDENEIITKDKNTVENFESNKDQLQTKLNKENITENIENKDSLLKKTENKIEEVEIEVKESVDEILSKEKEVKEKGEETVDKSKVPVSQNVSENTIICQTDEVKLDEKNTPVSEVEKKQEKEGLSDLNINKGTEDMNIDIINDNIDNDNVTKQLTEENQIETKFSENPLSIDTAVETTIKDKKEDSLIEIGNLHKIETVKNSESHNEVNQSNAPKSTKETKVTDEVRNDSQIEKLENIGLENVESSTGNPTDEVIQPTDKPKEIPIKEINEAEEQREDTKLPIVIQSEDSTVILNNLEDDKDKTFKTVQSEAIKISEEKVKNISPKDKSQSYVTGIKNVNIQFETENNSHSEHKQDNKKCDIDIKKNIEKNDLREDNKDKNMLNIQRKADVECVKHVPQQIVASSDKMNIDVNISKDIISKERNTTHIPINTNNHVCTKTNIDQHKIESKAEIPKPKVVAANKSVNNNNSAVPFGKWTSANRQEFLNKIKETKIPSSNSNTKQLKQPNDLNRRDVLKKIDSQRQTATASTKVGDYGNMSKLSTKIEVGAFINKINVKQHTSKQDMKIALVKTQPSFAKQKPVSKKLSKDESVDALLTKKPIQRKEINNQDLIDKTIEGIINRAITTGTAENTEEKIVNISDTNTNPIPLDDIEKKMNELHGIPYEEQTSHEIHNQPISHEAKNNIKNEKNNKIPNLVPFKNKDQHNIVKEKEPDELSDEEIIEHEPITGDINVNKQNLVSLLSTREKVPNESRKEAIITEKDFDKFARRNSFTYENCLTMSFDGKEPHNVIQTVVEKDPTVKKLSRNELMLAESKAKSTSKQLNIAMRHNNQTSKIPTSVKTLTEEDTFTKNCQSKVQIAYQSVLSAKRNMECPITIIEDKPVKVVYMDTNVEFTPAQLNVQGQELSPLNKQSSESSDVHSASESLDSDTVESQNEIKPQDDIKFKIKHQRKQVLTPVEEPELELIEPDDLGLEISPKKKRKLEDKIDKPSKNLVPKKSYLLNRNIVDDENQKTQSFTNNISKEMENRSEAFKTHTDTISAIDNLVKAAELIEIQQAEQKNTVTNVLSLDNSPSTPIKRGRGRPRKYPIPEQGAEVKAPSPQKKPRLIDAKITKNFTDSDDSSDGEIVKENWTMGKINENIVCPICNKLFRSENVVFKHVKHCTGPSPNRSDSDKRSPLRRRYSSERKSRESRYDYTDDDDDEEEEQEQRVRSRKSRHYAKSTNNSDDVIVIEDTPIKERLDKIKKGKIVELRRNITKSKHQHSTNNLICEFCGKTFRQLSYLVNHKIQHKKEDMKNAENEVTKSVFSCEVCKKEFRKSHHLVQHRIIHNSNFMDTRTLRKSSSEQHDTTKSLKNQNDSKQNDDPSAGFRCEPCDKSFRKLHHLVEHRETHDCVNKKGTSNVESTNEAIKPSSDHCCDICKKVFKKLQDYLEHKEQHLETSSEKSDDKSVKSSLSTKDIIHECSLCYMVFPNEHSLNKHTIICLRKKKQSATKQASKKTEEGEVIDAEESKSDETILDDVDLKKDNEKIDDTQKIKSPQKEIDNSLQQKLESQDNEQLSLFSDNDKNVCEVKVNDVEKKNISETKSNIELIPEKEHSDQPKQNTSNKNDDIEDQVKVKNIEIKEHITIVDTPTPKKKLPNKEKIAPTATKMFKSVNGPLPVVKKPTPKVESSDDDEVRYMLNPNFKEDDSLEGKVFMKVRAKKRNSLQIERPSSKDLIKRRISLQHPPKIPRLKVKAVEPRPLNTLTVEKRKFSNTKHSKPEVIPYTDSDDSDVKYSFPTTNLPEVASNNVDKKSKKQSLAIKRKSLSGIAKRKSLGKHKSATPTNKPKKRTTEVEHRCDCGQLFSSAALLSRHTTLAHTPPRIRRRRSPPPEAPTPTSTKSRTSKPKQNVQSKKLRSDVTNSNTTLNAGVGTRKSSVNNSETKVRNDVDKSVKSEPSGKKLRSSAHRGVPVPEKMRKLMEKTKK
ncbi:unnamed protein product [Euphydryas editha]|uniref:C2H2-type domain-containing protein n=1 Tax=Euphydryas editha TaxID=104508 RepID=A0AAU9V573_EUPED|nr:unnamed protein product [Euphydryas editha]